MGIEVDLAALAGMAGLGGSAIAATLAAMIFKGLIGRILAQLVVTAILSFAGFVALFHVLGFKIIPPAEIAGVPIPGGADSFSPQSVAAAPAPSDDYAIKSPWR